MVYSLIGAFINVTLLTRVANWLLKNMIPKDYYRAFIVFGIVTVFDFIIWIFNKGPKTAFHTMMLYYLPFLILWLLTDILNAAKKSNIKS
jgi:Ca2+/Na+ antiporter